ncbi:hypothetical protein U9M48_030393 [Paspalum notatum var. saurae]|uniref:SWIM-type domain-containing protein n=1 Tax=Paspalum notatum var. saurae TaxID=547442 RepID=A0AAQ3U1C1_PASNO
MQDFIDDMATKIIWGSSQELQVWGVDTESGSEWRVRDNDQFQQMIQCRLDVRFMKLAVDVIEKEAYKKPVSTACTISSSHAVSMVTGTVGDSGDCIGTVGLNVDEQTHFGGPVDWDSLVVVHDETNDGERNALVDEVAVYEAMGFAAFDNEAAEQAHQEYSIPCMSAEMDNDIREAAIPVDDDEVNEHVVDWDRENPEMVVQKIKGGHSCALAIRGEGTMASQAWVAERCIPLLKEKKNMGAKEVKERLHSKYRIDIPYQTVWYGRQRAANLLFGKWDDSYDWLYRFKAEVELRSPGSVVEIEYAKYMWPAARAYTLEKHKYLLDKVLQNTPGLQAWLQKDHSLLWTRSKFSEQIKCDYINKNLAESWNGWIKELKNLPPDAMADAIREIMVVLFEKRRKISMGLSGCILPAVVHQLNAASKGLTHLRVTKGNSEQAEVTEIYKDEAVRRHVVNLKDHHCTCRQWQISGKPCPHALALITTERQPNMEPFVDIAYSVQKFQAAYAGCIPNITDKDQWPHVDKDFKLLPPIDKPRGLGRQRKNRLLGPLERSGKATRQSKCYGCGEFGHRKGSWRCSLTGTKKRKRKPKKAGVKPGRKKSKQAEETEETVAATETEETVAAQQTEQAADVVPALPQLNTPRTRAAAAREAAMVAAAQAEHTPVTRRGGDSDTRCIAAREATGFSVFSSNEDCRSARKIEPDREHLKSILGKHSSCGKAI